MKSCVSPRQQEGVKLLCKITLEHICKQSHSKYPDSSNKNMPLVIAT